MQVTDYEVRLATDRSVRVKLATPAGSDDPIVREVASGLWQPTDALRWLLLNIKPGDRVLDLGAHVGTFSLLAAQLGAQVIAVEASPGNAELLRTTAEANNLSDALTVVEAAVTNEAGEVSFVDLGPYGTIETACTDRAGLPIITVSAITIDSLSETPFDWIKIDIEGAECAAISGGMRTLRQARGLAVEANGYMLREHGTSVRELLENLRALGFRVYSAVGQTLSPLGRLAFQPETTLDYVAVAGSKDPVLPLGWAIGRPRGRPELLRALVRELSHAIPQHRASALFVARDAPLWARCSPALRRAVRALDTDPHYDVVDARNSASRGT
jgi:FkbM family methyltransferase